MFGIEFRASTLLFFLKKKGVFRIKLQFFLGSIFIDRGPLNETRPSSSVDAEPPRPKVPSGDPEQWAPEDSDDAASAASTTWDISGLLLGLLYGPWSTRRRRTSRRAGSLYRHIQTAPTCNLEQLVSSDTAPLLPWPRSRLTRHTYRLSNIAHRRPRLSINHGCTDGTGPRPSFEPK